MSVEMHFFRYNHLQPYITVVVSEDDGPLQELHLEIDEVLEDRKKIKTDRLSEQLIVTLAKPKKDHKKMADVFTKEQLMDMYNKKGEALLVVKDK